MSEPLKVLQRTGLGSLPASGMNFAALTVQLTGVLVPGTGLTRCDTSALHGRGSRGHIARPISRITHAMRNGGA
jgi:hypothetical protein